MIGFVTLYPLPANKNPVKWSNLHNSLFIALSRPIFILGLMIVMTCMILDQCRIFKSFLSMTFWVPLAKLSYIVYLIFPIINAVVISSMSDALFLSYYTMFYLLAFNFFFCQVAGFFCFIFVEGPLTNLIFSRQIYSREATAQIQKNLLKIDENVRRQTETNMSKKKQQQYLISNDYTRSRSEAQDSFK